jgi:hypothetical protein
MSAKRPPKDANQLARYIIEMTTGDAEKLEPPKKNAAAVALTMLGASKGGKARADKLSSKKRRAIAKQAANARWSKANRKA